MINKIYFFIFLLIFSNIVFSQEIKELTPEGVSEDLGKNEEVTLLVAESSSLRIGNPRQESLEKHKFRVLFVTQDSINISIDGEKTNTIIVPLSQTRKVDIDKDNVFDASITVSYIRTQVASVLFKSLDEKIEKFESTTPSVPITETQENISTETESANEEILEEDVKYSFSSTEKLIILGVAIVLILILIIFLIVKFIRKKPKDENPW